MMGLKRRLAALERTLRESAPEEMVTALALDTGGVDLAFVGGKWVPCPDVAPILARRCPAVKVYLGFTAEEL